MSDQVTLTINGREYPFEPGETILDVAKRNDISIPTLCHLRGATPTGACRMCVVEVEKTRNLMVSCAAPAAGGMKVHTESERVVASRRKTLQFLLASGNHSCATTADSTRNWTEFQLKAQQQDGSMELCPVQGACKLQEYSYRYQVTGGDLKPTESPYPLEDVNPFIVRDFSRCIQCGRCVQACNGVQVNNAISYGYRGKDSKIVASGDAALADSDCVFCGECVQACPVGALVEKDTRYSVRPWEVTRTRTTCSYCGVGCQLELHAKDGQVVKVTGVEDALPNYGSLCVKGRFGYNFIGSTERLTSPLIKENGAFRDASWDEALDLVASRWQNIGKQHGNDSIGVLSSARVTNEENYIAQKFARGVLKTNNVDHCARL